MQDFDRARSVYICKLEASFYRFMYFLTGHGNFQTFLCKMNKLHTDEYICGSNGNPLHCVYQTCPKILSHFKCNTPLTAEQNFLILITKPILIKKLNEKLQDNKLVLLTFRLIKVIYCL